MGIEKNKKTSLPQEKLLEGVAFRLLAPLALPVSPACWLTLQSWACMISTLHRQFLKINLFVSVYALFGSVSLENPDSKLSVCFLYSGLKK